MERPDFILINGTIWTGDPAAPRAEAFAARNGVIMAAGSTDEIRRLAAPETGLFDAGKQFVIPGFTDSHTHFVIGGLSLFEVDLNAARDRDSFQAIIRRHDSRLPPGEWMCGGGWDQSRWTPPELPGRQWVDGVCPDRPAYFIRQDMHMALAGGRALERAGIDKRTPDPDGGRIDRDPQTGEPTGILRDAAMRLVERVIPKHDEKAYLRAVEAACGVARSRGVTSVHDVSGMEHLEFLDRAAQEEYFTLRLRSFPPLRFWKSVSEIRGQLAADAKKFRICGVKAFTDGSLGSRTALFFEPYADAPDAYGLPNDIMFPEGNLLRLVLDADKAGLQTIIHAIGDKANAQLLDIYRQVCEINGSRDRRWRIEHAQHVRDEDIPRFRELGVIASMQPYHCIDDARWIETRIGAERCRNAYAFKSFLDAGVPMVFGSDWTVAPMDPVKGIAAAVNRIPVGGAEPWRPEQRIPVEEALKGYTVNPPWSVFEERFAGSLSPGRAADCAVLSRNLLEMPPGTIPETAVAATIFNGRVVFRK